MTAGCGIQRPRLPVAVEGMDEQGQVGRRIGMCRFGRIETGKVVFDRVVCLSKSRGTGTPKAQSRPPIGYPNVACSRASSGEPIKPCHSRHPVCWRSPIAPQDAGHAGSRRLGAMGGTWRAVQEPVEPAMTAVDGIQQPRLATAGECRGWHGRRVRRMRMGRCGTSDAVALRPSKQSLTEPHLGR